MESDFQVTVKGLCEDRAREIANIVIELIRTLEGRDKNLDLRRMHRVILTTDFCGEINAISKAIESENPIKYTHEGGVAAIAKVLVLPCGDDFEILIVFDAYVLSAFFPKGDEDLKPGDFNTAVHYLHHELWHIHEMNNPLDSLYKVGMRRDFKGKDAFIRPLSELCWSEYFACRMSSWTMQGDPLIYTAGIFTNKLEETKSMIDQEILSYRRHADMQRLMASALPAAKPSRKNGGIHARLFGWSRYTFLRNFPRGRGVFVRLLFRNNVGSNARNPK